MVSNKMLGNQAILNHSVMGVLLGLPLALFRSLVSFMFFLFSSWKSWKMVTFGAEGIRKGGGKEEKWKDRTNKTQKHRLMNGMEWMLDQK